MSSYSPTTTALLLIDIQTGFNDASYWGPQSNPQFEENITKLLSAFRSVLPAANIIHIAHHSANPDSVLHPSRKGIDFMPYSNPKPGEPTFAKDVNSAFVGTPLEAEIRKRGIRRLYVCGLTADQCVSTTVRMANNLRVLAVRDDRELKENLFVVGDCTAAHDAGEFSAEVVQKVHLTTLGKEFGTLVSTSEAVGQVEELK